MNKSRDILFKLIRVSLAGESDYSLPNEVDWQKVFLLSILQNVSAFAMDGLQIIISNNNQQGSQMSSIYELLNSPKYKAVKNKWLSNVVSLEYNYNKKKDVVERLSDYLKKSGIKAILVKGPVYAGYYPAPSHRTFGDIDIYSPDKYVELNSILQSLSSSINLDYYRHSHCVLSGVKIENHRFLCDVRGQGRWKSLENELSQYARNQLINDNECGLFYSEHRISILFFLYHAQSHLVFESLSLRFLTDWYMILKEEEELISSEWFVDCITKFRLTKITCSLTSLCVYYFDVKIESLPYYLRKLLDKRDSSIDEKVINDIFRSNKEGFGDASFKSRLERSYYMLKRGWKYKYFLGVSPFGFVFEKFIGVISNKKEG